MPRERCSSWTCSEWWAQCSSRLTAGSGYHRVWKPCKAALPKELGWESMVLLLPSVVIPRGAAGGVESPLWEQGGHWGQSGEKRQGWNDQREVIPEEVLLSFWSKGTSLFFWVLSKVAGTAGRAGPTVTAAGRGLHFQVAAPSVLLSIGAQWHGLLDAAGVKACVQKTYVLYWLGGLCCCWGVVPVQARAGSSKHSS